MPTAMNVKDEKKAKTNIVRFETSTSPNWRDIKMFIKKYFSSNGLKIFVIYRFIFGVVILLYL